MLKNSHQLHFHFTVQFQNLIKINAKIEGKKKKRRASSRSSMKLRPCSNEPEQKIIIQTHITNYIKDDEEKQS